MSDMLSFTMDAASLASIKRLSGFGALLAPALERGVTLSLDGLESAAQTYMYGTFMNPTGALENAFVKTVSGSMGVLSNESPYGRRRNDGFSNMTDSLGRFFPVDEGIHYMEFAIENSKDFVETTFAIETGVVLNAL